MNWFWRAAIAVAAGSLLGTAAVFLLGHTDYPGMTIRDFLKFPTSYLLFAAVITLVTYHLTTTGLTKRRGDESETLCRKCGYILRGISEPRCPECGERI